MFKDWEVEKKINLGELLSMVGMLCTIVSAFFAIWINLKSDIAANEKRVTLLEYNVSVIQKQATEDRQDIRRQINEVKSLILRLEDRMNRNE